ncbi:hypothetical protein [Hydrogenophaga sp.]|uniref:hypothetical protein n=1 Tax=Hydrogenophaga sp. TaxID=1904254 RepID=UPI003D13F783
MSTTASPFPQMVSALASPVRASWPFDLPERKEDRQAQTSRTEQIRQLLRMSGPLSALNIAAQVELERPALVSALLKVDLQRGRVRRIGPLYDWNHGFDEALARELGAAARLLRTHGFTVRRAS